ncbi:hypothetical protein, partial [Klebsiella pneumoniae]|uniref:hypothetical protein n=1 Tax=Klebsiella pneumoniae TaxID=573 RepID=UPI0025A2281F
ASTGHRADEPNGTVTAGGGGKSQLVTAFLAKHFGGNYTGPGAPTVKLRPFRCRNISSGKHGLLRDADRQP